MNPCTHENDDAIEAHKVINKVAALAFILTNLKLADPSDLGEVSKLVMAVVETGKLIDSQTIEISRLLGEVEYAYSATKEAKRNGEEYTRSQLWTRDARIQELERDVASLRALATQWRVKYLQAQPGDPDAATKACDRINAVLCKTVLHRVTVDQAKAVMLLVAGGEKIEAINALRGFFPNPDVGPNATKLGLKDAKEAIEAI